MCSRMPQSCCSSALPLRVVLERWSACTTGGGLRQVSSPRLSPEMSESVEEGVPPLPSSLPSSSPAPAPEPLSTASFARSSLFTSSFLLDSARFAVRLDEAGTCDALLPMPPTCDEVGHGDKHSLFASSIPAATATSLVSLRLHLLAHSPPPQQRQQGKAAHRLLDKEEEPQQSLSLNKTEGTTRLARMYADVC